MNIASTEKIYSGEKTNVYRGRENDRNVIVKVANSPYPEPEVLSLLELEYSILTQVGGEGVVQAYHLGETPVGYGIVMEDFGGKELTELAPVDVKTVLKIGLQIARSLARVHAADVIHKDVNPKNILFNPETGEVKIIDFNAAGRMRQESVGRTERPVGTPAYMSPEQTGRMNRYLDYRTDFYSLGATLYFLLTGRPPFAGKDMAELVHSHVALNPAPVHAVNPKVPKPISDLVHKLLAKNAEDRYQSAEGLAQDLEYCLSRLGSLEDFVPGRFDAPREFRPPQKLYGRQTELKRLFEAFESVCVTGRSVVVSITGVSGIGKSALIHEVQKPLVREKGYFVEGKYDQYQRNVPFSGVAQALSELVRQILTESPERIENWKAEILAALGANAKVIIDVVPELEWLLGPQPDVVHLSGNEALNRAKHLFGEFVKVFAKREHPLVVFLDDLQWADSASLQWLENQATAPPPNYLMLICAYRDNEVGDDHPLRDTLKSISETREVVELRLQNLTGLQIEAMLDDALDGRKNDDGRHQPLAELILRKTAGNPFFVTQFLTRLYEEKILYWNDGRWTYNYEAAEKLRSSDNVVEFLLEKLRSVPETSLEALQTAALLGASFDEKTLAEVTGWSLPDVRERLTDLSYRELVVKSGDVFRFQHDRIQQAAYNSIAPEKVKALHLRIARKLAHDDDKLFDAVGHYDRVLDEVRDGEERNRMAKLFAKAGKKARDAAAFDSALRLLETALSLLPDNAWMTDFLTCFEVYTAAGECAFIVGDYDKAERYYNQTIANIPAEDFFRIAEVYKLKINMYGVLSRHDEAIRLGDDILRRLGFRFGYHLSGKRLQLATIAALLKAKWLLRNKSEDELINAPECTDERVNLMREIGMVIAAPVFLGRPEMMPANTMWQVPYWLKHGPSASSTFNVIGVALVLNALGEIKNARHLGDVGIQLYKRFEGRSPLTDAKTYAVDLIFSQPLREPFHKTFSAAVEHFKRCREVGEATFGRYTMHGIFYTGIVGGVALSDLHESARNIEFFYHGQKDALYVELSKTVQKYACILMDKPMDYELPPRTAVFEKLLYISHETYLSITDFLMALYDVHDPAVSYENILGRMGAQLHFYLSTTIHYEYVFAEALLRMRLEERTKKKHGAAAAVKKALKRLEKSAEVYADNWAGRFHLLKAEWMRFSGNVREAETEYDKAVEAAKKGNGFNIWGLAAEWAAKFYLKSGRERAAQGYLREAHYAYGRWGATALVRRLEAAHPFLVPSTAKSARSSTTTTFLGGTSSFFASTTQFPGTTTGAFGAGTTTGGTSTFGAGGSSVSALDFDAVIKATQALSMEVNLNALLDKLMRTVMENAGAEKGVLLLQNDDFKLAVQAAVRADGTPYPFTPGATLDALYDLPRSIVYFVFRTRMGVVLHNAAQEGDFSRDEYIAAFNVKSVLCTPVLNRGDVVGVLYLENNLTTDAFTPQRFETVNLLAAQAGISIENARLYENLERKVEIRTKELSDALTRLKETQDELIRTEKMASVGKLVKNVSHEINTPLGAIKASGELAQKSLKTETLPLLKAYVDLEAEHKTGFGVMLETTTDPHPPASTRDLRQAKKNALVQLNQLLPDKEANDYYADAFAGIGFDRFEEIVPLLKTPEGKRAIDAALRFAKIASSIKNILQAEARTEKITQTLRTLAAVDDPVATAPVPLKQALEHARQSVAQSLTYGVELVVEGLADPKAVATPEDVEKVLSYLLHNAYQWSNNKGKITVEFHELINDEGKFVVCQVRDEGPGVDESRRHRIFEPFYSTLPEGQGSGLGLYLSKLIVEKYGGKIRLNFPAEGGTVAEFALPAAE